MLLWLLACPHRDAEPAVRTRQLLAAADAAWLDRGARGLDGAAEPLRKARELLPEHPGVAWREARLRVAEGLAAADPGDARQAFAEARATAVACLETDGAFVARRAEEGWGPALSAIGAERAPCVAWAALAWARWMGALDPAAASLDLDTVDALVARAEGAHEPEVRDLGAWADGLLSAQRPTWAGRDPARAERNLRRATEAFPESLVCWVDLYEQVVEPHGTDAERAALRDRVLGTLATTPEDRAAQQRLGGP